MRSVLALGFAAWLAFVHSALAQDKPRPHPTPPVHQQTSTAPKPPKAPEAAPQNASTDPIDVDQREQKLLDEKLKGICRGC
jgi:hypothetical protein